MMGGMEFADVVRRRKMVRNYTDEPVDPAVVDRALANAVRAPSAGFSQGWGFLVLDTPDDVRRYWAATADDLDDPDEWLQRHDARAGRDRAVLEQGGLPGPLRRARQGLDRPRRGPLAGAVLAHGRRDGLAADPADARSTRDSAPASSASRPTRSRPSARSSRSRTPSTPSARSRWATPRPRAGAEGLPDPAAAQGPRRGRAPRQLECARLTWGQSIQSGRRAPPDLRRSCLGSEIHGVLSQRAELSCCRPPALERASSYAVRGPLPCPND